MCGVGDLKLLSKASADANMYGMDTISAGGHHRVGDGGEGQGPARRQGARAGVRRRPVRAPRHRGDRAAAGRRRPPRRGQPPRREDARRGRRRPHRHRQGPGAARPHAAAQALARPHLRGQRLRRRPPVLRARLRCSGPSRAASSAGGSPSSASSASLDLRDLSDDKVRFAYAHAVLLLGARHARPLPVRVGSLVAALRPRRRPSSSCAPARAGTRP